MTRVSNLDDIAAVGAEPAPAQEVLADLIGRKLALPAGEDLLDAGWTDNDEYIWGSHSEDVFIANATAIATTTSDANPVPLRFPRVAP